VSSLMTRILLVLCPVVAACSSSSDASQPVSGPAVVAGAATRAAELADRLDPGEMSPRMLRRFKPLNETLAAAGAEPPAARIDLGRMLFFDTRLSRDGDLSCNSCHRLDRYGVDNRSTSVGAGGARGRRNAPSVYHAAGQFTSFWDGRAANVDEQALGPIVNPAEMAMPDGNAVVAVLRRIPGYVTGFRAAFPDEPSPVSFDNVGRAIGAFERQLVTPSRWDHFLAGNRRALTALEVEGLRLFNDLGCGTCHTGRLLGGSTFQKAGAVVPWPDQTDQGRFEVTGLASDRMLFKVPSLRNVARTAPYFHDGSVRTLEEAVTLMARHQTGDELSAKDVAAIVAWLGSLTGELPAGYIAPPQLPG
jgi:cytochrome c peroxidase